MIAIGVIFLQTDICERNGGELFAENPADGLQIVLLDFPVFALIKISAMENAGAIDVAVDEATIGILFLLYQVQL